MRSVPAIMPPMTDTNTNTITEPQPQPPTPFAALAATAGAIAATRGRNAMADLAGGFLSGLAVDEIAPAARLLIGRVFPDADPRTLDVAWTTVWRVVLEIAGLPPEQVTAATAGTVDGGEADGNAKHAATTNWHTSHPASAPS